MTTAQARQHEKATTAPSTPARPSKRLKRAPSSSELNVEEVILGDRTVTPSYPSLYREEIVGSETLSRLYVCEGCFKYTRDAIAYVGHRRFCEHRYDPPGELIYKDGQYSILEVDGDDYHLFTQNLSLFAKLFIDTKSVCFDASTFLFYLLVSHHPSSNPSTSRTEAPSSQIVGFFSKEKLSWDNNNLACILIFPPWQKLGLGQMLMAASYELSKRDGRLGGPERPLSTAGAASYAIYWGRVMGKMLLEKPSSKAVDVKEIAKATCMVTEDVIGTLLEMGAGEGGKGKRKDGSVAIDKVDVRKWLKAKGIDIGKDVIDHGGFVEWSEDGGSDDEVEEDD